VYTTTTPKGHILRVGGTFSLFIQGMEGGGTTPSPQKIVSKKGGERNYIKFSFFLQKMKKGKKSTPSTTSRKKKKGFFVIFGGGWVITLLPPTMREKGGASIYPCNF